VTTFLLIRHAETDYVGRAIAGWKPGVTLNARGIRQAAGLADTLAMVTIDGVYSSPLERARETALAIAAPRQLDVRIRDDFGEMQFGDWTDRSFEQLSSDPQWRRFNSFRAGTRIPNGEMMLETQARMVSALERLRTSHPADTLAIVSHGDVIKSALTHFLGMPLDLWHRIELAPASVSAVAFEPDHVCVLCINGNGTI
jgi:probable phosphomutase (TIGR03848 family)